jgi:hypothetical protein
VKEIQKDPIATDSQPDIPTPCRAATEPSRPTSRRVFLKAAGIGAVALAGNGLFPGSVVPKADAVEIGPAEDDPTARGNTLQQIRNNAAAAARQDVINAFPHTTNGDEEHYADQAFAGNFSKTLPHDSNGLVDPGAYQALLTALEAGTVDAFNAVPAGGRGQLAGPVSPLVFQIEGSDSVVAASPFLPPSISSGGGAAEMVELYWEAYLRDVPFINYDTNPLVAQAVTDMNHLSAYAGPTPVTSQNLFRYGRSSLLPLAPNAFFGCDAGPYISQLLYATHELDGVTYVPMINTRAQVSDPNTGQVLDSSVSPGVDFLTNLSEYIFVEDGNGAMSPAVIDPTPRFVRSVRDLGSLAASDSIFSIYFRAAIILAALGVPLTANNPYRGNTRINGFSTFSTAWLFAVIGKVHDTEAQAFYQKWYVHRKLRPEAFGNLVDGVKGGRFTLTPNLDPDVLNSAVLPLIFEYNRQLNVKRGLGTDGSFLHPQELNGGSPSHPASPAGHAFTAGACVTALKAVFDTTDPNQPDGLRRWPVQPVQAAADGLSLVNVNADLTVLGELNKLAANISEGRNMSGIHWRVSDNMHGMFLGEDVAIHLINEAAPTYPESFAGFTLTRFNGTTVTIGGNS